MDSESGFYRIPSTLNECRDVFVVFAKNGHDAAIEALENIPFDFTLWKNKRILIKPNAGRLVSPNLGINTSPEVVAGILDFFLEKGVRNLVVGDSPILGVKSLEALEKCGIAEEARKRNVEIVDLDAAPPVKIAVPSPNVTTNLKVCRLVTEVDHIVSIPVMKTHMHTMVSLGLKNMKGCLYEREKVRLHQLPPQDEVYPGEKPLDIAISDLAKVLLPDLTVVDGIIGQDGMGPSAGTPKSFGAVVASFNCMAADVVASELMGIDPVSVRHLQLAFKELKKSGIEDFQNLEKFKVFPENYIENGEKFQPPPEKISFEFENVVVEDKDSCSACLSTALMFLKRYEEGLADYYNKEKPLRIALGKGIGHQKEGTLLIGNCTAKWRDKTVFIKGCPPVASDIWKAIRKIQEEER